MAYCASLGCSRFAWGIACSSCGKSFCAECDRSSSDHGCASNSSSATTSTKPVVTVTKAGKKKPLPFDEVLGQTSKVHVYSNKNDSHFSGERMYVDGIYSGYKWQCVEFARRWLLLTKACQFREVMRASEIWDQNTLVNVETGEEVPVKKCPNGGKEPPVPGSLIIYPYEEKRTPWGHVGIITHVTEDSIGIAEQNLTFSLWHPDQEFGRKVPIQRTPEGGYYLHEEDQPPCLGWMVPEAKERDFSKPLKPLPEFVAEILPGKLRRRAVPETPVELDLSRPSHALFASSAKQIPWSAVYELDERRGTAGVATTNEALRLIDKCVDYMVSTKEHLPSLPAEILQRAFDSWEQYKETEMSIYGRLDFGFDGKVDKLLKVSLDSLSCALLCPLQDAWIKKVLNEDPPFSVSQYKGDVKDAWEDVLKNTGAKMIYFIDTSDNNAQQYNALALYETTQSAGLPCTWLTPNDRISIREDGVFAPDGEKIEVIFKTCPWSSVFLDMQSFKARLLLHPSVFVLEPLWKALIGEDFLQVLKKRNPSNTLLLAEGEEFNIQEPTAGRYPASGVIVIAGHRSASFVKDSIDPSLSDEGPFGPAWFNIHDRT